MTPLAVLGAGSWGTALAVLAAGQGRAVRLWGHDPEHVAAIAAARCNTRYLPECPFPDNLSVQGDLAAIARETRDFLVVVPSHAFRATLANLATLLPGGEPPRVAWGTKGLEPGTGALLSEVAAQVLGPAARLGVFSGPTFAREIARGLPAALTAAAADLAVAEEMAGWLRNDRVRVYTSVDVVGVQLGGAIKNVMAIAAGISDGLGFGANARAALITRGLAELTRLGVAMGGRPETFAGLAGLGDLVLTCTDDQSRNRRVGLGLGRGASLAAVLEDIGQEAEGVKSTREVHALAQRQGVEMPITEQVYRVLYEGLAPTEAVGSLMQREPKSESDAS